jgi:hypothetical protein|tara:strand:- start:126 stop:632 length:507 start_codon:yes stop_codon:yes gene_type:complete
MPLLSDRSQLVMILIVFSFPLMIGVSSIAINMVSGDFYQFVYYICTPIIILSAIPLGFYGLRVIESIIDKNNINYRLVLGSICIVITLASLWEFEYILASRPMTSHISDDGYDSAFFALLLPFLAVFFGIAGIYKLLTGSRGEKSSIAPQDDPDSVELLLSRNQIWDR